MLRLIDIRAPYLATVGTILMDKTDNLSELRSMAESAGEAFYAAGAIYITTLGELIIGTFGGSSLITPGHNKLCSHKSQKYIDRNAFVSFHNCHIASRISTPYQFLDSYVLRKI